LTEIVKSDSISVAVIETTNVNIVEVSFKNNNNMFMTNSLSVFINVSGYI